MSSTVDESERSSQQPLSRAYECASDERRASLADGRRTVVGVEPFQGLVQKERDLELGMRGRLRRHEIRQLDACERHIRADVNTKGDDGGIGGVLDARTEQWM